MFVSLARLVRTSSCKYQKKKKKKKNKFRLITANCKKLQETQNEKQAHLQDFNLSRVCGADVETLQVRLEHPL